MSQAIKTTVTAPVVGQVYMAQRVYNSKRMVMEPFRYEGLNSNTNILCIRYRGTWAMDCQKGCTGSFYLIDLKWVNRKLIQLSEEQDFNNRCADNLINLLS